MELQQLNETTNAAVTQLQYENKQLSRDINDLDKQLQDVSIEKTNLIHGQEKELVNDAHIIYSRVQRLKHFLLQLLQTH